MEDLKRDKKYELLVYDLFCKIGDHNFFLLPPCNFNQLWSISLEKEQKLNQEEECKKSKSPLSVSSKNSSQKLESSKEIDFLGIVMKQLNGLEFKNCLVKLLMERQDLKEQDFEFNNQIFGFDINSKNDQLDIQEIDLSNFIFKQNALIFGEIKYSQGGPLFSQKPKFKMLETAFDQQIQNFLIFMNAKHFTKYLQKEFAKKLATQTGNFVQTIDKKFQTDQNQKNLKEINSRISKIILDNDDLSAIFLIAFNGIIINEEYLTNFKNSLKEHLQKIISKLHQKTRANEIELQIIFIQAHIGDTFFQQEKFEKYIKSKPEEQYVTKEEFNQKLDQMEKKIDARFQQIDTRFQQIDTRFESMENKFDMMEQKLQQLINFLQKK